jgi:hypothetical protein
MSSTTVALLDRWKESKKLASDYQAAKALSTKVQTVSNWRTGKSHADVLFAARMAEDLGMSVIEVLAAIQADREHRPSAQAIWRRFGRAAFMALAGLGLGVGVPQGNGVPAAQVAPNRTAQVDIPGHYARRKKRHRGAAWAWRPPLRAFTAPCYAP